MQNAKLYSVRRTVCWQKRDIVYLQQDDHTELMDIFFPEKAKGMLPVIVDVHGGGWVYGNKELNEYYCMELGRSWGS